MSDEDFHGRIVYFHIRKFLFLSFPGILSTLLNFIL
jgi:hypothetical protein